MNASQKLQIRIGEMLFAIVEAEEMLERQKAEISALKEQVAELRQVQPNEKDTVEYPLHAP